MCFHLYTTNTYTTKHLFFSLLQCKFCDGYQKLSSLTTTISFNDIEQFFKQYLSQNSLSVLKPGRQAQYGYDCIQVINDAIEEATKLNSKIITTEHILLAFLKENCVDSKIKKILNSSGVSYKTVLDKIGTKESSTTDPVTTNDGTIFVPLAPGENAQDIINKIATGKISPQDLVNRNKPKTKHPNIDQYCVNLNDKALNDNIDKIVGREKELNEIIQVLARRRKNNVVVVGPDGAGKTCICENLAYKIINQDVPEFLIDKIVISLDMTALVAGTTLRGMFEERVKGILEEIKKEKNYILFIDNIGNALNDKSKNDYDITSMLSHSLENGELQVISTCGYKSFRKTFDKDPSLTRKFQKIIIDSPTTQESIEILKQSKQYYEQFHNVVYENDAIEKCVTLAEKYIPERNLPDSAIDIMDEAGAVANIQQNENEEIKNLRKQLKELKQQLSEEKEQEHYDVVDSIEKDIRTINTQIANVQTEFLKNIQTATITENDIFDIVSKKTGIPINKLSTDDKQKLLDLPNRLKAEIIGQDEAIDIITKALKRNRIGLSSSKCLYSALLQGPTGVGKTLIAKKLAKEIFGDENALVRFDMSEYPDKSAVNKLIGSNPGYIGYEDGGQLTEAIKNKKYCVLLLDEIEKADPEVYNIFLQVLDEGFLTDNSGMKVDFKNVIVLFTSNTGSKAVNEFGGGIGFNVNENDNTKKILKKELKKRFPPEFLNRINNVIYFNKLNDEDLRKIIKLEMDKFIFKVNDIGYNVIYDSYTVTNYLLKLAKEEKEFGARPIARIIQTEIENKLADMILLNEYPKEHCFEINIKSNATTNEFIDII